MSINELAYVMYAVVILYMVHAIYSLVTRRPWSPMSGGVEEAPVRYGLGLIKGLIRDGDKVVQVRMMVDAHQAGVDEEVGEDYLYGDDGMWGDDDCDPTPEELELARICSQEAARQEATNKAFLENPPSLATVVIENMIAECGDKDLITFSMVIKACENRDKEYQHLLIQAVHRELDSMDAAMGSRVI